MSKEKLMNNVLQSFEGGIAKSNLIKNTFHSDYDFNEHPEIECGEAIGELIRLGILKETQVKIWGEILEPNYSVNYEEIIRRLKEHEQFGEFLDDYFVLEIDEFRVWIPQKREGELKELCKVFLKETKQEKEVE